MRLTSCDYKYTFTSSSQPTQTTKMVALDGLLVGLELFQNSCAMRRTFASKGARFNWETLNDIPTSLSCAKYPFSNL